MDSSRPLHEIYILATRDRLVNGVWKREMQSSLKLQMEKNIQASPDDDSLKRDAQMIDEILTSVLQKKDVYLFDELKYALGMFNQTFCKNKFEFEGIWYALFHFTVENCLNANINAVTIADGIGQVKRLRDGNFAIVSREKSGGTCYLDDLEKRWEQHITIHDVVPELERQSYYYITYILDIAIDLYNLPK